MIQANKFRLGLFVLAGTVLFITGLFVLGLEGLFVEKAHFVSLFPESVQGLTIGSPVKYKGVPIGTVSKIKIQVKDKLICVDMDINLSSFSVEKSVMNNKDKMSFFYRFIKKEREKGLRCRLEYAGITGLKYIELDYFEARHPRPLIPAPKTMHDKIYLPSTPSALKDILKLINTSLERIAKIDFEKLSDHLSDVLEGAKKVINGPKLLKAIDQMEAMSANLQASSKVLKDTLTPKKVKEIINNVDKILDKLHLISIRLEDQLIKAKIAETTDSFRKAANSVTDSKVMISNTLLKVNQAIDSFTEFINYLNDDPGALLTGKSKEEIHFNTKK